MRRPSNLLEGLGRYRYRVRTGGPYVRSPVVAVPLLLLLAGTSGAQSLPMKNDVRVQVNMSFYVRGSMDEADASVKAQEQARKVL